MLKFPGEEERTKSIRENLREQFAFVEKVYEFAANIEMTSSYRDQNIDKDLTQATGILNAQGFRLFRTIFEECSRAEGFCARLALRSLFETTMAMSFVLKPEVYIRTKAKGDGKGGFKKDAEGLVRYSAAAVPNEEATPKDTLSREFRANLYLAYPYLGSDEHAKACEKDPALQRYAVQTRDRVDANAIAHYEKILGEEWSYVSRKSYYSGLSVSDLAKMLHPVYSIYYEMIYSLDSGITHGSFAYLHLSDNGTNLRSFSTDGFVFVTLKTAVLLFLALLIEMQNNIGFGEENERGLESLNSDQYAVFHADKQKT